MKSVWHRIDRFVPALVIVSVVFAACVLALGVGPATAANGSVTYTYDALGRVTSVSYDTGVLINYSYDANGNRTQQVINVNTGGMCWNGTASPCTGNTSVWGQGTWIATP